MALPPGFPVTPSSINLTQINVNIRRVIRNVATKGFWGRVLGMAFEFFVVEEVLSVLSQGATFIKGGLTLWWVDNHPATAATWIQQIADKVTQNEPLAVKLAAATLEQITGVNISGGRIAEAEKLGHRPSYQNILGQEFTKVVDNMLSIPEVQRDFSVRNKSDGSFSNLNQFFGINMDFQLRSLTISTISSIFGIEALRHLEGLHQSINWAYGFGWLSWAVLSNAMDVTVNHGVKQHYLRQVKPNDLSVSQANRARIRNLISPTVWGEIHDNVGTRDDARNWQLELEFKDTPVSALQKGWDHRLVTDSEIDEILLHHEYTPRAQALVKEEVENNRKWKLQENIADDRLRWYRNGWVNDAAARTALSNAGYREEEITLALQASQRERLFQLREAVTKEHMKFLRHGWETESDARTWLQSQGWSEEEIQLAFEANRLEQKAAKLPQPKHLSLGQVAEFVANGFWDGPKGLIYLINLGYDHAEASDLLGFEILQHVVSKVPKKVRDECETSHHFLNLLTGALRSVQLISPLSILSNGDYMSLVGCYLEKLQPASTTTPPPPPQGPPTPQALTAVAGTGKVDLSWQAVPGLVYYQVYRRSIADAIPFAVGTASPATTYTDVGLTKGQIYIYTVHSKVSGVESGNSNEVQVVVL